MITPAGIASLAGQGIKAIGGDDDATTANVAEVGGSMLSSAGVLTSASLFIVTNADGKSKDAAQSIVQSLELD